MRWSLIVPVFTTIGIGSLFTVPAIHSNDADAVGLAASVWIILAITWGFVLWNSAGSWRPEAQTTAAFLDLSIRRCLRAIRAIVFGAVLYVAELAFCFTWILRHQRGPHRETLAALVTSWPIAVVWLATPVFGVFIVRYWRLKQRQLRTLEALRRQ